MTFRFPVRGRTALFHPEEMTVAYGTPLPFMFKPGKSYLDRAWPEGGPSQDAVLRQLRDVRRCVAQCDEWQGTRGVQLLAGAFLVKLAVGSGASGDRLWLVSLRFATNADRQRMMSRFAVLGHEGLRACTSAGMAAFERSDEYWRSGAFVARLLDQIDDRVQRQGVAARAVPDVDESRDAPPSPMQQQRLETLRTFIDAEFEIEERVAQQEPTFAYSRLVALSSRTSYRQFYELELTPADHRRMQERKPGLLSLNETDVLFQVVNLAPTADRPLVHLSVEAQAEARTLAATGELALRAIPTLRTVRSAVLGRLAAGESANPWLLRSIAGEYEPPVFSSVAVSPPAGAYPPTDSQMQAIVMGASTPDYGLVLGPPGTGKTTVIQAWVRHFVQQGLRVLVTSQNNKAVDNVLKGLAKDDRLECVRVGSELKVSLELEPLLIDNKARTLQERLFRRGEDAVAYFDRALDYLKQAREQVPARLALRRQLAAMDERVTGSEQVASAAVAGQRLLEARHVERRAALAAARDDLRALDAKSPTRMFGKILSFVDNLRRPGLQANVQQQERALAEAASALRIALAESSRLDHELHAIRAQRQALRDQLSDVPPPPPVTEVPEIALPAMDELTPAKIDDLEARAQRLRADVSAWYDRLRSERQQDLYRVLMEGVNVVGATCIGINTNKLFSDIAFDVVIVDEAAQIQLHNVAVPLSRARKVLLVGDHKQLPPVVDDRMLQEIEARGAEDDLPLYERSWFESLWEASPDERKVSLDTQFRCPKPISDYVATFYDGRYHAGAGMAQKKPLFSFCPGTMMFLDTSGMPERGERTLHVGERDEVAGNPLETMIVVDFLEHAIAKNPELARDNEIGIIVPYARHVDEIRREIQARRRSRGAFQELSVPLAELVASVDSFQGQERDLILFPLTRCNRFGRVGFLADWRRLNVAMTRTKRQLVMVGDLATLTRPSRHPDAPDRPFKEAMRRLGKTCHDARCLLDAAPFLTTPLAGPRGGAGGARAKVDAR